MLGCAARPKSIAVNKLGRKRSHSTEGFGISFSPRDWECEWRAGDGKSKRSSLEIDFLSAADVKVALGVGLVCRRQDYEVSASSD